MAPFQLLVRGTHAAPLTLSPARRGPPRPPPHSVVKRARASARHASIPRSRVERAAAGFASVADFLEARCAPEAHMWDSSGRGEPQRGPVADDHQEGEKEMHHA